MKTVFVGLSGGVDSGVSAYLLKKAGYNVVGVFLKVWEPDFLPCTAQQDRLDAMRVAAHLEIPFYTYDLEAEYKKNVVDYFVHAYKEGLTPNPDVMCNREIKFGAFWDRAKKEGADYIATGHYARNSIKNEKHSLARGIDESKDQAYFLWTLTQDDLMHTLFPVGGMSKDEVRALAEKIKLPNAKKRDSQGLCFLGHVDMKEFLMHYIPVNKGAVHNEKGEVVGEHDGVFFYTLDQRISVAGGEKMYVIAKDIPNNTLTVSSHPEQYGKTETVEVFNSNWIRHNASGEQIDIEVRYHGERLRGVVVGSTVTFSEPTRVASGQSLVFYSGEECLGGAIVV